ncbi:hypothetical protein T01_14789 [Trichinella spiralis]|uniref:Secreted protein n=1 Tax=Trichinella spiralis TaxID=6334 RepID=A0A0V1BAU6_TRISP|nr:hypothetical protein T01_14789 [Trichinella spiralis]
MSMMCNLKNLFLAFMLLFPQPFCFWTVKHSPNMKIAQKRIVSSCLWDVFLIGKHAIPVRAYMELLAWTTSG